MRRVSCFLTAAGLLPTTVAISLELSCPAKRKANNSRFSPSSAASNSCSRPSDSRRSNSVSGSLSLLLVCNASGSVSQASALCRRLRCASITALRAMRKSHAAKGSPRAR